MPPDYYTPERADRFCEMMAEGWSWKRACEEIGEGLNKRHIAMWLRTKPDFKEAYLLAKQDAADSFAQEILEIADDGTNDFYIDSEGKRRLDYENINRSRLRVDTRKWLASKLMPKRYGDRLDIGSDPSRPLIVQALDKDEQL